MHNITSTTHPNLSFYLRETYRICNFLANCCDYARKQCKAPISFSPEVYETSSKTGSRIRILYLLTGPIQPRSFSRHCHCYARIDNKLAVMTYKVRSTTVPTHFSRHIKMRESASTLRLTDVPLLIKPFIRTEFAFRCSAPSHWNSQPMSITRCNSLPPVFKSSLNTYYFCLLSISHLAHTQTD